MSPRISRVSTNSPFFTSTVGRSGSEVLVAAANAPTRTATATSENERRRCAGGAGTPEKRSSRQPVTARCALSTAPSSRPDATTTSWAFVSPSVTGRSSNPEPRCTRDERPLAVAPDGVARHRPAPRGWRASSTSSDAVRSGIRFGCEPSTLISTMKVRTFGDSVEMTPSGEICAILPAKRSSGYASRPTVTACPRRRSLMSAWLTRARTRMAFGLTMSTTGTPARTSSPSWTSAIWPDFQIVLRTTIPPMGAVIAMRDRRWSPPSSSRSRRGRGGCSECGCRPPPPFASGRRWSAAASASPSPARAR